MGDVSETAIKRPGSDNKLFGRIYAFYLKKRCTDFYGDPKDMLFVKVKLIFWKTESSEKIRNRKQTKISNSALTRPNHFLLLQPRCP